MQRWPAVPTAEKSTPRTTRSRSALGATIAALLPPSSSSERPSRAAIRGASSLPICVEPVAETSGIRGSSASWTARSAPPITSSASPSGTPPNRSAARSNSDMHASAVSGVRSDGFQITGSPQTKASAAFQLHTATGKLKALITATGPSGCHVSVRRWPGTLRRDRAAVELAREADREVADVDHLLHLAEPLLRDLPDLERDERAERLLLAAQLLAEQPHELATMRAREVAPGGERLGGAADRGIGRGLVGAGDLRDLLAGDRRADDEVAAVDPGCGRRRAARAASIAESRSTATGDSLVRPLLVGRVAQACPSLEAHAR